MKRLFLSLLLISFSVCAMDDDKVPYPDPDTDPNISYPNPVAEDNSARFFTADGDDWMDGSLTVPTLDNNKPTTIDGDDWVLIKEIESIPTIDIEDYLALVWNYVSDVGKIRPIYDVRQAQRSSSPAQRAVICLSNAQLREQALACLAQEIQKPYDQFRVFGEQDTE